jgi:hydroxymethylbilane synthase
LQARTIRIGTRGSPLALAQSRLVEQALRAAYATAATLTFDIRIIKTTGDRIQDRPLSEAGGKGLFTKEIEAELLAGTIDIAVHSMKDMPTLLPRGLSISCFLPREDVRDVLVSRRAGGLDALPQGATLATSSLRRQAQVKRLRPDLSVIAIRGNVETRLRKLETGAADATLLASAGLKRLGLEAHIAAYLPTNVILPAIAQGAIGVETRSDDTEIATLLAPINHEPTALAITTERAFLSKLDGSCRTPIAGLAELTDGRLHFRGMILTPDGSQCHQTGRVGRPEEAILIGEDAAAELLSKAGPRFFSA